MDQHREGIEQIEARLDLLGLRVQRELSRKLVDHPRFHLVRGMLVRFRKRDGTWKTRRFRNFAEFGILPPDYPTYQDRQKERFDLCLDDYATAAILLRMYMEQGGPRRAECSGFADGYEEWIIGWRDSVGREYELSGGATPDIGIAAARALLAVWEPSTERGRPMSPPRMCRADRDPVRIGVPTSSPTMRGSGGERTGKDGRDSQNRLGERLVKEKFISPQQLQKAIETQRSIGGRLGHHLTKLGSIEEDKITAILSRRYGVPSVNLSAFEIDPEVLRILPRKVVSRHQVIPVNRAGKTLIIAMSDPANIYAIDDVRFITNCNVEVVVASDTAIAEAISRYYTVSTGR